MSWIVSIYFPMIYCKYMELVFNQIPLIFFSLLKKFQKVSLMHYLLCLCERGFFSRTYSLYLYLKLFTHENQFQNLKSSSILIELLHCYKLDAKDKSAKLSGKLFPYHALNILFSYCVAYQWIIIWLCWIALNYHKNARSNDLKN